MVTASKEVQTKRTYYLRIPIIDLTTVYFIIIDVIAYYYTLYTYIILFINRFNPYLVIIEVMKSNIFIDWILYILFKMFNGPIINILMIQFT